MFDNVLVAVDEFGGGRDAVALGRRLAGPHATLTLAHIVVTDARVDHGPSAGYAAEVDARSDEERARALVVLRRARARAHIEEDEADLACPRSLSVGRGLHEFAEACGADVLVVGSSRRGLLGRVLLGDHTRAALNGAPCAMAIPPAGYLADTSPIRRVGVGYDGSPESEHALAVARTFAAEHGAQLSACTAVMIPGGAFGPGPLPVGDTIAPLLAEARRRIVELGGAEAHAGYGTPVDVLSGYSEGLDLLVVGSRGHGPMGRIVHGSSSRALARSARCPLLVLPRGGPAGAPRERPEVASDEATLAVRP